MDRKWNALFTIEKFHFSKANIKSIFSGNININDYSGNINIYNILLSVGSVINANGNSYVFPNTWSDYKISWCWHNQYGFGIHGGQIKYIKGGSHNIYKSNYT